MPNAPVTYAPPPESAPFITPPNAGNLTRLPPNPYYGQDLSFIKDLQRTAAPNNPTTPVSGISPPTTSNALVPVSGSAPVPGTPAPTTGVGGSQKGAGGVLPALVGAALDPLANQAGTYLGNRLAQGIRRVAPPGSPLNPRVQLPPWYPDALRPPSARVPTPMAPPIIPGALPVPYKPPSLRLPANRRGPDGSPVPYDPPSLKLPDGSPQAPSLTPPDAPGSRPSLAPPNSPDGMAGLPGPRSPGPPFRGGQTQAAYQVTIEHKGNFNAGQPFTYYPSKKYGGLC
jgi:hypothetical protein